MNTTNTPLQFITCGSVDDGKSTLIGRLLLDSRAVMQDQLEAVSRTGAADLALLTDGLSAEREQGITIDVAWRYFATPKRKFIIGDCPGHEQYTRNMVTAASKADCAVVLVDVTKLDWRQTTVALLAQTRRHTLLCKLLRVPHVVFAINKLDALGADAAVAYANVQRAVLALAGEAGVAPAGVLPVSGLAGSNVLQAEPAWGFYRGPALLPLLEGLQSSADDHVAAASMPVQWVEKTASASSTTAHGRRIAWGRVASGSFSVGDELMLCTANAPSRSARIAKLLSAVREPTLRINAGQSAGVVLDMEVDMSRGDWFVAQSARADDDFAEHAPALPSVRQAKATLSWLDDEPLVPGRLYWALHGHRWVKAKVTQIDHRLDIHSFAKLPAAQLAANDIAQVQISFSGAVPVAAYADNKTLGAMILVDASQNKTSAAVLIQP